MKIIKRTSPKIIFLILVLLLFYQFNKTFKTRLIVTDDDLDILGDITMRNIDFEEDVLGFVHIPMTSSHRFEQAIVSNLIIKTNDSYWKRACEYSEEYLTIMCHQNSYKKPILWDPYFLRLCGKYADHTETKTCIMREYGNRIEYTIKAVHFYGVIHVITILKEPISRYISEFRHIKETEDEWEKSVRVCKTEKLYVKKCMNSDNATWNDFLNCEYNQANNRQTRMLANYDQHGCRILKCWTRDGNCTAEERRLNDKKMLESAKQTLVSLSFFGLSEYQFLSQYLFEKTFKDKMKFTNHVTDTNDEDYETSVEYKNLNKIKQNNHLDIELYQFAKTLFFKRIKYFQERDQDLHQI